MGRGDNHGGESEPMTTAGPRPDAAPPWREALIGAVALLVALGGLSWWLAAPIDAERPGRREATTADLYVGSKVCGECHPGELASFEGSGHARTLRRAASIPLAKQ